MIDQEALLEMPIKLRKEYNQELRIEGGNKAILIQRLDGGGTVQVNVSDLIHWMMEAGKMAACLEHGWTYSLPPGAGK